MNPILALLATIAICLVPQMRFPTSLAPARQARAKPLVDRSARALPASNLAYEWIGVAFLRRNHRVESLGATMHRRSERVGGRRTDVTIRVIGEKVPGCRNDIGLGGAA